MPPSTSNRHSIQNEEDSDAQDLRIEMENVGMKTEQAHIPQTERRAVEKRQGSGSSVAKETDKTPPDSTGELRVASPLPVSQIGHSSLNENEVVDGNAERIPKAPLSQQSPRTAIPQGVKKETTGLTERPSEATNEDTTKIPKPKIWDNEHDYVYLEKPKLEPWETIKRGLDKNDDEMAKAWNDELNTLLTFTGLFSAAVTAFCAVSLQTLSQNPADTTNAFLMAISLQLSNSSSPVADFSLTNSFIPNSYDVQINVLYFISLTLALSVSSVCILGKQWIREYQKDIAVSPCDAARVRQMRYNSLQEWKVPHIMAALPVILLIALMLFFAGLLVQLWNISDKTTAAAVFVIVALTVLLVIVTTVVPAWVSLRHDQSAFAPFRSPQAWIVFYAVRRLQHWYHPNDGVSWSKQGYSETRDWKANHPILSNWAEFDLYFLKMERQDWFQHKISSVHSVLKWVFEVLRNSSEMEKSLLWCLQSKYHPKDLIKDEDELAYHVLRSSDNDHHKDITPRKSSRLQYDISVQNQGHLKIDSPVGRYQAELLIRSAHRAIDDVSDDIQKAWEGINHSYDELWSYGIFDNYSDKDVVHHQHSIQDQIALLLERTFSISPPSQSSFEWNDIIMLLLRALRFSSSPLSRHILPGVIHRRIPTWIRMHKSTSLLNGIGAATSEKSHLSLDHAIQLFGYLDKMMVEMYREPAESGSALERVDEKSVGRWKKHRAVFVRHGRRLPTVHFDNPPLGHGSSPVPPPSSHRSLSPGPADALANS